MEHAELSSLHILHLPVYFYFASGESAAAVHIKNCQFLSESTAENSSWTISDIAADCFVSYRKRSKRHLISSHLELPVREVSHPLVSEMTALNGSFL